MEWSQSILDRIGRMPRVRLARLAARLPVPVPVFARCEFLNPGGSAMTAACDPGVIDAAESVTDEERSRSRWPAG